MAIRRRQSDYGGIVFKRPSTVLWPTTVEELARTLQSLHARGERVTVRNTAHSTNGQTLTDGPQINVGNIRHVTFDPVAGVVTAGVGASWDAVLKAIDFPRRCLPLFPNNPGQRIHIGGTASVGGVGFYGSRVGGFWNHVRSLKLVTMSGEIVECSPTVEPELFRFSLGGFGRIGVIAEITVGVLPSKPNVLPIILVYFDPDRHQRDFDKAMLDPRFNGVVAQEEHEGLEFNVTNAVGKPFRTIMVLCEVDAGENTDELVKQVRADYGEDLSLYLKGGPKIEGLDLAFEPRVFPKRYLVYFTPREYPLLDGLWNWLRSWMGLRWLLGRKPTVCRPWSDCVVTRAQYPQFMAGMREIIKKLDVGRYLEKSTVLHGLMNIDSTVTFVIKRQSQDPSQFFPLVLDLPNEPQHSLGVAIMPDVPRSELERGLRICRELTDLVYSCEGRRYLYGTHALTREQVEKHYGRSCLNQWQKLKDQNDPKHLLNIGVIEHVDA
jgi:FAD/FMN-containing dehydrogenase